LNPGQAAQQRLVDVFMRQMFSETGLLGNTLANSFQQGALTTETAIERGFRNGVGMLASAQMSGAATTGTFSGNVAGLAVTNGMVDLGGGMSIPLDQLGNASFSMSPGKGQQWKTAAGAALALAGSFAGAQFGGGPNKSYSGEGASIGALIGGMTPLGPIGSAIGGVLGGLVGGAFKRNVESDKQITALERIERNTRQQIEAIENQTRLLTPESRFLNVPAGFVVPGFRPFGVSGGAVNNNAITINVNGGNASAAQIADEVATALTRQLSGRGSGFDVRVM